MSEKQEYNSPKVTTLGKVAELTESFNKVHHTADIYTAATGGQVVGSLVPAP